MVTDPKGDPPIIFKTQRYPELNLPQRDLNRKELLIFDPDPSNTLINSVIEDKHRDEH